MRLVRSRGLGYSSSRDFDAERADLLRGYQNEKAMYESILESKQDYLSDPEIPASERKAFLENYRDKMVELKTQYDTDLQQINEEEAAYNQEQGGDAYCSFGEEASSENANAQDFCDFGEEADAAIEETETQIQEQESSNDYGF